MSADNYREQANCFDDISFAEKIPNSINSTLDSAKSIKDY